VPNRTLTFAYVVCAVFAAVIAFLLATTAERTIYVLEDSQLVWISENDGTHDNDEVAASVQRVADDHGTSVGYIITDVNEPSSVVHLYLAVADPASHHQQWLEDGYPSFGRDLTVTTQPMSITTSKPSSCTKKSRVSVGRSDLTFGTALRIITSSSRDHAGSPVSRAFCR
jgi:hypothetical protein